MGITRDSSAIPQNLAGQYRWRPGQSWSFTTNETCGLGCGKQHTFSESNFAMDEVGLRSRREGLAPPNCFKIQAFPQPNLGLLWLARQRWILGGCMGALVPRCDSCSPMFKTNCLSSWAVLREALDFMAYYNRPDPC